MAIDRPVGAQSTEFCLECEQGVQHIISAEEFFTRIGAYRRWVNLTECGVRIGSSVYCLHCWTFQPKDPAKKPLQRESTPELLRAQWDQLNQRSRWYTSQTWQGPFAFITIATIAAYNLAKGDNLPVAAQAIGFWLLTFLGIAVDRLLNYVSQGVESSVRLTMRIELHPQFLRTSALEGARDPGGFLPPSTPRLRRHRLLARGVVGIYAIALLGAAIAFSVQWFREIFR